MADRRLFYLAEPRQRKTAEWAIALNRAFDRAGLRGVNHQRWGPVRSLARALGKLGVQRKLVRLPGRACLVGLMWPNDGRLFPYSLLWDVIPYIWDCWPPDYPKWEALFRRHRIRVAFISAKGSAEHFRGRVGGLETYWVPEACDPADYRHDLPLADREIDVLELGRKYPRFHDRVEGALAARGRRFLYSPDGSRTYIFADQAQLRDGLGRTRIAVSFPKSMTHPQGPAGGERKGSGGLETVTLRYFEQMASKCVVLGHCPGELEEVFGYNPVVEADLEDPAGQIETMLSSIDDYQALVDRNHARLLEVGTWDSRVERMLEILRSHGYAPPS